MIIAVNGTGVDVSDLTVTPQLDWSASLTAALVACLILAALCVAGVVWLSKPKRRAAQSRKQGTHTQHATGRVWQQRIADIVDRYQAGDLPRRDAFDELAALTREYASSVSGKDMRSDTLLDIGNRPRSSSDRQGLESLRQTIAALYPPQFADTVTNESAREATVEQAAEWVSKFVERWR